MVAEKNMRKIGYGRKDLHRRKPVYPGTPTSSSKRGYSYLGSGHIYLPMKICVWCRLRSALKFPRSVLGPQRAVFRHTDSCRRRSLQNEYMRIVFGFFSLFSPHLNRNMSWTLSLIYPTSSLGLVKWATNRQVILKIYDRISFHLSRKYTRQGL